MWWAEKEFANERESRICFVHCLVPKVTQVLVMTVGPQMEHTVMQATSIFSEYRCDISLLSHAFPAKRQGASAKMLQLKAADILPLDGLARFKQDPINRGYGAQNRPPPAVALLHCIYDYSMHGRSWGAPSHVIHMK